MGNDSQAAGTLPGTKEGKESVVVFFRECGDNGSRGVVSKEG